MVNAMTAILVVEDDPGVCDFLVDVLEADLSAEVKCAKTGPLATEAIDNGLFDLAIIDIGVPRMSGFELAKRAADRQIPSLLCSGHPDALAKLEEYGFPYIAKPFRPMDLLYQSAKVITQTSRNISRVKGSYARLQATTEARRLMRDSEALCAGRDPVR
jgi:DNA-binding NtrC family response regulator